MKICSRCGNSGNDEDFIKGSNVCKPCKSLINKKYQETHKSSVSVRRKEYRAENIERLREDGRKYNKEHADRRKESNQRYQATHKEEILKRRRELYRLKHLLKNEN